MRILSRSDITNRSSGKLSTLMLVQECWPSSDTWLTVEQGQTRHRNGAKGQLDHQPCSHIDPLLLTAPDISRAAMHRKHTRVTGNLEQMRWHRFILREGQRLIQWPNEAPRTGHSIVSIYCVIHSIVSTVASTGALLHAWASLVHSKLT